MHRKWAKGRTDTAWLVRPCWLGRDKKARLIAGLVFRSLKIIHFIPSIIPHIYAYQFPTFVALFVQVSIQFVMVYFIKKFPIIGGNGTKICR
jgi:hypothetical protein